MSQILIILDGTMLSSLVLPTLSELAQQYHLQADEIEPLYDWVITEAFAEVLHVNMQGHIRLANHHRHDVYRYIYDHLGTRIWIHLTEFIKNNGLTFLDAQRVKIMVTYTDIVIVKTVQLY